MDCLDDARVSATAADVALQRLGNFDGCGIGILLKQSDAAHDHAGCAVGALKSFGVEEGLLDRMEVARLFEAFDGGDGFSSGGGNRSDAGTAGDAVEENGAGATLTFAATVFGAGKAEFIAKEGQQRRVGIGLSGPFAAVNDEFDRIGHKLSRAGR